MIEFLVWLGICATMFATAQWLQPPSAIEELYVKDTRPPPPPPRPRGCDYCGRPPGRAKSCDGCGAPARGQTRTYLTRSWEIREVLM